jgi:F0F1-type ATP synthase delta subunit
MAIGIIFIIFLLQVLTALGVVFFLSRRLSGELINIALEQFETLRIQQDLSQINEISVFSVRILDDIIVSRVKAIASKRFNGISMRFLTEPGIKGGMIIMVGDQVIDCSARSRLGFLWGGK